MGRKVIEIVQVLVDRIEKNGYQQRAREENAFDLNKRLTEAEGWVAHWKQARQEAHEAGELMKAELEKLRNDFVSLQWIVENIKTMAGGISVQDADGCSLAVGQIKKYFNAAEYPLCNPQQDAAAWQQQVDSANAEVSYLQAELAKANENRVDLALQLDKLRQQLDAARAETVETRRRLNEETDRHRATNAEKIDLFQQKEWANKHNAELREQLDAANAAVTLQRAGIERLQAFVETVREARDEHNGLDRDVRVEAALAELDAEPTPVTEPLDAESDTCPGK